MPQATKNAVISVGHSTVWRIQPAGVYVFEAGLAVDADGAPNAYGPAEQPGLDFLENAGHPGNWWALVTDNGERSGTPVVQTDGPHRGFYISQTSLRDRTKKDTDISKYVDATQIPYYVLPPEVLVLKGTGNLGDLAIVRNKANARTSHAVLAEAGPPGEIGEGSIRLAENLDLPTSLRAHNAGVGGGILYVMLPNTRTHPAWPRDPTEMQRSAVAGFEAAGGTEMLRSLGFLPP